MIQVYLKQTPTLVESLLKSYAEKDWLILKATAHKMIPSFAIMGISTEFAAMAKKVQNHAEAQEHTPDLEQLIFSLERVCLQSCKELKNELNAINTVTNEN